jgi:hypothetical protein
MTYRMLKFGEPENVSITNSILEGILVKRGCLNHPIRQGLALVCIVGVCGRPSYSINILDSACRTRSEK